MVILITGASRGIGAALAKSFTESGHKVLLISRNQSQLNKIVEACNQKAGKVLAFAIPFDLTDLTDLETEFVSRIKAHSKTIDALVNNAGQLIRKPFSQTNIQDVRNMFDVNFFVPAQLIRICLPHMAASGLKHVVNVTSMAGFQGSGKFIGLS